MMIYSMSMIPYVGDLPFIFVATCELCVNYTSGKQATDKAARDGVFDHLKDKHDIKLR